MANASWQKWTIFLFNALFLVFLAYMSVIIGAIFTQHRDDATGTTIAHAMSSLHIDSTYFVYERAALATLLLVLMAVDRTMERWRMQMHRAEHAPSPTEQQPDQTASPPTQELENVLQSIVTMNQQNLQALAEMNRQAVQDALQQSSRVTVELVRETVDRSMATIALSSNTPALLPAGNANTTEENEAINPDSTTCSGEQESEQKEDRARYGPLIETLYQRNADITVTEIVDELGCSRSTASKWLQRVKPVTQ
jgi:predicted transcriptional regulator